MEQTFGVLETAAGDRPGAAAEMLPSVYGELRKLAAARMANERDTSTLQPTALVHEAWLRLAGAGQQRFHNRAYFFAAAAEAMRRVLIDHARRKHSAKRGAGLAKIELDQIDVAVSADEESLLRVDEALEALAAVDPPCAQLIKLRFFAGMNYAEAAEALGISERTAKRYWRFGRAWLYQELTGAAAADQAGGRALVAA